MNILLFSDLHLTQQDLPECIQILEEIGMLSNQYNVDLLIDLGDSFDSLKPTSLELDCFATFIKRLNKKMIILAADSHESETEKQSILNHYGILNDTITVIKEYHDESYLYCGHFIVKEAKKNFGTTISKLNFKKYKYVFLGHQHEYEIIKPNICQLGSSRYVNFDEAQDKQKTVAIIEDYKGDKERVIFVPLKSPIPMIDIELQQKTDQNSKTNPIKDPTEAKKVPETSQNQANPSIKMTDVGQLCFYLDQLPEKTKIRIIFKDYNGWLEFLPLYQKYKNKFTILRDKKDFIMSNNLVIPKNENVSLKESLIKWMEQNKIDEKIKLILLEELK